MWLPSLSNAVAIDTLSVVAIRLVLAEDNVLLRDGLVRLFSQAEHIDLLGSCGDLPQLLALVADDPPDVVLTDIRMPPTNTDEGIQAARYLRTHHERGWPSVWIWR